MSRQTVSTTLLALAFLLPFATTAQAQTPAATVKDDNGNVVLKSFTGGELLAPSQGASSGDIPAEDAGTRLMWYPGKAAFRAGEVDGSQWNDTSIGDNSVAFGEDTKASEAWAVAMGNRTTASAIQAVAMGFNTTASADEAVAMGRNTTAKSAGAVAMGAETTAGNDKTGTDAAKNAVAMGDNTTASGPDAVAMGEQTTASAPVATAMGNFTTASRFHALAAGDEAAAEDPQSFVWNDGSGYHGIPNTGNDGLSSGTAVSSEPVTGSGTFSVSAQGGVRFVTGSSQVTYIEGGTTGWSTTSTRAAKTNVTPVDPAAVLAAVQEMPLSTWEYKTESGDGAGTRHLGPMAEDFHGALPYDLGSSTDHINSINLDGVALGAVKGLARKVETQKERIAALETETEEQGQKIADLEKRLAALEAERSSSLPAGWGGSALLVLLTGLGGLGAGLIWCRTAR